MGYYKPLPQRIQRGQRFGDNPGWGPNPPGGHNGDDYLSQVGEPVYAAGDGVVVFAGRFDSTYADNWGWNLNFGGQMVVLNLDGGDGPYVEYGHLSEIRVSTGDRVRARQVIALTGADDGGTGVITGPHLHVGCLPPDFNLNTNTYGRVNPDLYLTDYPDEAGTISAESATITPLEEDMPITDQDAAKIASAVVSYNINQEGGTPGQINLGAALAWYNANNKAVIDGINGQIVATGNELTSALKKVAPADLAQQINAAGVAAQVRDELVKLLGGAK